MPDEPSDASPDELSDGDALLRGRLVDPDPEESSVPEEHPAAARAITQVSPAAGLRKVLIAHAPTLVISVSTCLRMETKCVSEVEMSHGWSRCTKTANAEETHDDSPTSGANRT
ncbi:hypothetical protein GCM10010372_63610 [Streptomyces tauricus]|nr:hypothetical protein GCM10010372_63610 [Streptomyces tauricus]